MNATHNYKQFCKPKLAELLEAVKLDIEYTTASGNYLYTEDGRKVLDFIGGFGATLLGHNHPELVDEAIRSLKADIPCHAQSSIRGESARLARRLNELLPTDQEYLVNFTNSGAESIEAAIKHAYKVHFDKVRREYEQICRVVNDFYHKVDREHLDVNLPQEGKSLTTFRDDVEEHNLTQFESFQNKPVMVAFKGSFHGKTTSALKVTFNKSYREAFEGLSAIETVYLSADHPERLAEIVQEQGCTFYYPVLSGLEVTLRPIRITRVIGLVLEVIQGEGGIRPLPEPTLEYLARIHGTLGVPLIVDEIQTGCGRLGHVYAYANTALAAVAPEYIALSKALGGGLAKIGATLIRKDIYDQDFGILHTSTFCEDEFSSRIALRFLDILTRNQGELLLTVAATSAYLVGGLRRLQAKYPALVRDVRGGGLMLGLEFTPLDERSPFFRSCGKQGVLSLLIASYLLEYHDIRLFAPLSTMLKGNPGKQRLSILRIQPPVTVTPDEMDRLIGALDEVLAIIERNNEYCLIAHLAGVRLPCELREQAQTLPAAWPIVAAAEQRHIDARTGFIVHPMTLDNLIEYYFPSFQRYPDVSPGLRAWWNCVSRFLEPIHILSSFVSSNDFVVENNMVFVPYLPEYIVAEKPAYLVREVQDKVQDAVTIAKELGDDNIPVSMVGLGAYTSIVTRNGETLNDYEVPVTTGNAYTTALTVSGIIHAAERQQLDLRNAIVGIVGAAGNIGTVIAQMLASHVGSLRLVGRPGKDTPARLKFVRQACWTETLRALARDGAGSQGRLASRVAAILEEQGTHKPSAEAILRAVAQDSVSAEHGKLFEGLLESLNEVALPIHVDSNLDALHGCDVVVVATSSPERELILPNLVKPGAIVCCASMPSNLSTQFNLNLRRNLAFDGGLARLPDDSVVDFVGMPKGGLAYGCLAETFLLGFDGQNHSFCKGVLTVDQVCRAMELADLHGFALGELKLDNIPLDTFSIESAAA